MEERRRSKWEKFTRPSRGRPPRARWQPAVPSWEKQFCRVVGSIEWETLLQMKKFVHLYPNVLNWDDSAGKEAFFNAKERFWAELNGLSCETSLPDPNLYIDEITWDSELNLDESEFKDTPSSADEHHEPVIIFGDSLLPTVAYSSWSDQEDDENLKGPSGGNNTRGDPLGQTPVGDLNEDVVWNYEQEPASTDNRIAAEGVMRRNQRSGNRFPRRHHHRGPYWGQLHSADKRTHQRV